MAMTYSSNAIRAATAFVLLLASSGGATAASLTELQQQQVAWAEGWGHALFDAYKAAGKVSDITMDRALAAADTAITDKCKVRYKTIVVAPPGVPPDKIAVYVIGDPKSAEGVMIGRHYRVSISGDGRNAESVTVSSRDCSFVAPQDVGQGAKGIVTAAMDAPAPTEIHVFLSLATGETLFVQTKAGYWYVKDGKIDLLQPNQ
jgi:hypothetical protein